MTWARARAAGHWEAALVLDFGAPHSLLPQPVLHVPSNTGTVHRATASSLLSFHLSRGHLLAPGALRALMLMALLAGCLDRPRIPQVSRRRAALLGRLETISVLYCLASCLHI